MNADAKRCGFVAILGAPNAGKSTLVNTLVGQKVSIVSRKVQTTRMRVRGIISSGSVQLILVDTPGIFSPRRRLDQAMVDAAWGAASDADAVLVLVDAFSLINDPTGIAARDTDLILNGLNGQNRSVTLAVNKVDAVPRMALLPLVDRLRNSLPFDAVFMIAGSKGDGVEALRTHLESKMPEGPWAYPPDQAADLPIRLLASEVTREHLYDRLHEELPYASMVETDQWTERSDGSVRIDQTIYVQRDGQRGIVLGQNGATIKAIGAGARKELESMLERTVHLFLHVKVKENWAEDPVRYRGIGLDFPSSG